MYSLDVLYTPICTCLSTNPLRFLVVGKTGWSSKNRIPGRAARLCRRKEKNGTARRSSLPGSGLRAEPDSLSFNGGALCGEKVAQLRGVIAPRFRVELEIHFTFCRENVLSHVLQEELPFFRAPVGVRSMPIETNSKTRHQ